MINNVFDMLDKYSGLQIIIKEGFPLANMHLTQLTP